MPATTNPIPSSDIAAQDRAYALRLAGATYAEIAATVGFATANVASQAVWGYCRRNGIARRPGWTESRSRGAQRALRSRYASTVAPTVTARRFGVEIECFGITPAAAANALRAAGLEASHESYNHSVRPHWKVVTDSSVNNAGTGLNYGLEVVSPILSGEQGLRDLRTAMKALKDAGARVDRSCGMHVHHECDDLTGNEAAALVMLWSGHQGTLNSLVAPSRRQSHGYCAAYRAGEAEAIANRFRQFGSGVIPATGRSQFGQYDRYRTLNVASFPRYGTIEIRQHQGTLNGEKASAWVQLGQAIITAAKANATLGNGEGMLNDLTGHGLAAETAEYLAARMDALA